MTTLHYIVGQIKADCPELLDLPAELSLVGKASKVSMEILKATVTTIKDEHKKLTQELSKMEKHYEEVALEKLRKLKIDTSEHAQKLESDLNVCTEELLSVTKFFGEDTRKTSPTDFLCTLNKLMMVYGEAVNKITSNPNKYKSVIRE